MRFLADVPPPYELTYNDVFMVPRRSDVAVAPRRRPDHARRRSARTSRSSWPT